MRTLGQIGFVLGALVSASAAFAADQQVERGRYLVTIAGCNDCHTPGYFLGKPDFEHALSGSDVGFGIPGFGDLRRPQSDAGQGDRPWRLDGRPDHRRLHRRRPAGRTQTRADHALAGLAHLDREDALAIVAYLRSLPPVKHAVPGPFGPKEVPSTLVMTIIPGEAYSKLPPPPQ